jgi:ubiquinone/menaquinone biosynthesis C-methylase UbiE
MSFPAKLALRLGDIGLPRINAPELIDSTEWSQAELAESFRDIERVNRYLGGTRLTLQAMEWLVGERKGEIHVLDCGSGSCDIPAGMVAWGRSRGTDILVTATDASPEILEATASMAPSIGREVADICSLPHPDKSVDIVTCSLLFHHLSEDQCRVAIGEMARVARIGYVVNDLLRSSINLVFAHLLMRMGTKNRLTRHDGPLSIRRAYTPAELLGLVQPTGSCSVHFRQFALYRAAVAVRIGQ